jgi:hypothetical protein
MDKGKKFSFIHIKNFEIYTLRKIMKITNQAKNEYRRHEDITDPKTFEIAERFQSYQRRTAENIIEMSRVVVEAKSRSEIEFEDFCLLIGYPSTSSTIRKLVSIGQKYEYLISRSDKLPPAWTVIYEISRMDEVEIEGYIEKNSITSLTNGAAVNKLLDSKKIKAKNPKSSSSNKSTKVVPNGTFELLTFSATLLEIKNGESLISLEKIFESLSSLGFELEISDYLRSEINESKTYEMITEESK